jgi:hypothetical protein
MLLAATLAGAASAAVRPAAAGADPLPEWNIAPCATATLTSVQQDESSGRTVLFGSATQCDPVVNAGGFRIATYLAGDKEGEAPGYNARRFPSPRPGDVRPFGAAIPRGPVDHGVCVIAGKEQRIACGRVSPVITGSVIPRFRLTPVSPNDPLVAMPVRTTPYTGSVQPNPDGNDPINACGTCF